MAFHAPARRRLVAHADRVENLLVNADHRLARLEVEDLEVRRRVHGVRDRGEEGHEARMVAGVSDAAVPFQIRLDEGIDVGELVLAFEALQSLRLELVFSARQGRLRGFVRLDRLAGENEVDEAYFLALDEEVQGPEHRLGRRVGHIGPAAVAPTHLDQSLSAQHAQSLANRRPAHLEPAHQFALARQRVPDWLIAAGDRVLEVSGQHVGHGSWPLIQPGAGRCRCTHIQVVVPVPEGVSTPSSVSIAVVTSALQTIGPESVANNLGLAPDE